MKTSCIFIGLVTIVVFFMGGCVDKEKELETENKNIARRYMDKLWNEKNLDELNNLVSADFVNYSPLPGMPPDREGLKQFLSFSGETFPDGHYTIEDMIAEGNKVMIRGSFEGTHRGEFMGVSGSGKEIPGTR